MKIEVYLVFHIDKNFSTKSKKNERGNSCFIFR